MRRKSIFAAVALQFVILQSSYAQFPHYVVIDLGTLGGDSSYGNGVNNSGQVTGYSYITGNNTYHAFLYPGVSGTMQDLGTLGGNSSQGNGINNFGQVTGETTIDDGHAFLYSSGSMQDLGTLGGISSLGSAINNSGQITGYSLGSSPYHAILYSSGSTQYLGTLGDSPDYGSVGNAINDSGQVTGWSYITGHNGYIFHAFLYPGVSGTMQDLGTLGGSSSQGNAINHSGQVAGFASTSSNATHAFLYNATGMNDLGALNGTSSNALGINDCTQIVGNYNISGTTRAFFYTSGSMVDLNNLVPANSNSDFSYLSTANGINNYGYIVGSGITTTGQTHAFLAVPTPQILSMSPNPVTGVSVSQKVNISGTNFAPGCTVTLRDLTAGQTFANRVISALTPTQITINPNFTTAAHNWSVEVLDAYGNSSGQFPFNVVSPTNASTISGVGANPLQWSSDPNIISINGSGFAPYSTVTLTNVTVIIYLTYQTVY